MVEVFQVFLVQIGLTGHWLLEDGDHSPVSNLYGFHFLCFNSHAFLSCFTRRRLQNPGSLGGFVMLVVSPQLLIFCCGMTFGVDAGWGCPLNRCAWTGWWMNGMFLNFIGYRNFSHGRYVGLALLLRSELLWFFSVLIGVCCVAEVFISLWYSFWLVFCVVLLRFCWCVTLACKLTSFEVCDVYVHHCCWLYFFMSVLVLFGGKCLG